MTAVKICGVMTAEHALAAATAGADLVGLVFAPSRRQITLAQALPIVAALRRYPRRIRIVGLFVNAAPELINTLATQCDLDYVQLSGDELPAQAATIQLPLLKSVRLNASPHDQAWLAHTLRQCTSPSLLPNTLPAELRPAVFRLLVDAHVAGQYGGTGTLADWEQAASLAQQVPIVLAGGLTPENVAAAIQRVRPWGVDVSSGVERDGVKDPHRIAAFVHAAHQAG
ncbi:MAG: phosphoribosylanthranilate isomerase [Chloroflexaceae bacterium]|nr:phosphoribosylanthranilate isomerase [Chloroflexaceae bacterium]